MLVSHSPAYAKKTICLNMFAQQVGVKIGTSDDAEYPSMIKVKGEDLPTTEWFIYLSSTVKHDSGTSSGMGILPQQGQEHF